LEAILGITLNNVSRAPATIYVHQPLVPAGQDFQLTLTTLGRLMEPEQFANIVLKTDSNGEIT
jgi:hypothetical protein